MKVFVTLLFLLSTSLCMGALSVGIGKQDLTPPIGSPSAGYSERKGAGMEGVHDPLLAIALFIDNGEKKIVFCSVDHLGFMHEMVQEVIQKVHSYPGLSDCDIYIGSSHTHSGGGGYLNIPGLGAMLAGPYNPDLRQLYIDKTVAAIIESSKSPISAKIGIGYGNAPLGLSYYRALWPLGMTPLSNIAVIKVTTLDDKPYALLFNYSVHPTLLNSKNRQFSSDFVGYAREEMSGFGQALFFNGAQGDVNPTMSDPINPWNSCASFGNALAKSVEKIWQTTAVSDSVTFKTIKKNYAFVPSLFSIDHYDTELNLIVINEKDAFITIPGELSCIYDKHLKEIGNEFGYSQVSVLGLVNDAHGYIITPDAWRHKTKESALSFGGEEYGDFVEKNAIHLLKLLSPFHFPKKLTKEEVKQRLSKYLIKDPALYDYVEVGEDTFLIYDSPESKASGKEEWRFQFDLKQMETPLPKKTLKGTKIALDPGHFGGSYAYLEARFVDMQENIHLEEGTLTLLTALHLKSLLEKEGAEVMLTKTELGKGAICQDFFDWLKENPHLWRTKKTLPQLFRDEYNSLDLKERAKKINAFGPDLTLIIHYNAHDSSDPASPFTKESDKNFNMTFIPGSFCQNELKSCEAREEFIRMLVTQDLENSSRLSSCVTDAFTTHLKVPSVTEEDGARYLENVCLKIQQGVYARNLALTRLVSGPLCYGETLVQNHPEEAKRLAAQDTSIANIPCSSRVKEVAEAYFEAIQNYFDNEPLVNLEH